ncbi:HAD family hydrolase [Aliarcobacter cryaerophilus]|uniref:HAD family hydrolase n=1 Tax=Aliarcobacter cryaerophilus TaxID=28198 RepID=UPI0021B4D2AF|nr:HAD hydrolase-like protein [Aliarcobacter cryaerophilus]MCT7511872.1 HAD hydrolase-like protein [Aliarcobacter cryaerophilus]
MIKNILWDFDGVILNSMKIKGDGFIELFKEYDEMYLNKLEQYHYDNGGVSRFEKIKYFYNEILQKDITEREVIEFADKFAEIINKNLFNPSNLIEDSVSYIKENYKKYNFHIVSGAEHNELNELCKYFELAEYFISIDGSPTKKDVLVKEVLEKFNYKKNETILIGDAITDYEASMANGIGFYGFNNLNLNKFGNYINYFNKKDIFEAI